MRYSQNIIEDIRINNDIIDVINRYVSLKQRGRSFVGLCPFHNEKTPSFHVSPDEQLYHCFGCNASGNVYSFIMQIENLSFMEAIKFLADRINYSLPENNYSEAMYESEKLKKILYEIHKKSARFFYNILMSSEGYEAVKYLEKREVSQNIRRKYGLGFSGYSRNSLFKYLFSEGYELNHILQSGLVIQDRNGRYYDRFFNRLMFPIIDIRGNIIAFGGRIIGDGEPKYLNSPDTEIFKKSYNLYSLNFAKQTRLRELIIVEGYMDVISLFQAGFKNTVAALGTAFNSTHAGIIKRYADSVILLFDSDTAGTNAALRAINILSESGINPKVLQVKNAKDPDEYIKKFGPSAFSELLKSAKNHIIFQIENELKKFNIKNIDEKILFTNKAASILASLQNNIERAAYVREISNITKISEKAIEEEINKNNKNTKINFNNISHKNHYKSNNDINAKRLDTAIKDILGIMTYDKSMCKKITDKISIEEFGKAVYIKFAKIILSFHNENKAIYSADIVSYFDSSEEQKIISEIFLLYKDDNDINITEKAIDDQIKLIKNSYSNILLSKAKDDNEYKFAFNHKRKNNGINDLDNTT